MAIRWTRGFFRLWLALSVIWIALAGWLTGGPDAWSEYWRARNIEIVLPGVDAPVRFPFTSSRDAQMRQLVEHLKLNAPQYQRACRAELARWEAAGRGAKLLFCLSDIDYSSELRDQDFERVASQFVDVQWDSGSDPPTRYQRAADNLVNIALIALVPAFVLFALGAALTWAMRGFSAKKAR